MEIQITAIKFETVNGKKTGKSFAFKLDPKKLAVFKTEATLKKKIKEYVAKSGIFKKEELDDVKYNMKDFLEEWKKQVAIVQAEELAKLETSPNNPDTRITPDVLVSHQTLLLVWLRTRSLCLAPTSKDSIMVEQPKQLWRTLVPLWAKAMAYRGKAMQSPP